MPNIKCVFCESDVEVLTSEGGFMLSKGDKYLSGHNFSDGKACTLGSGTMVKDNKKVVMT